MLELMKIDETSDDNKKYNMYRIPKRSACRKVLQKYDRHLKLYTIFKSLHVLTVAKNNNEIPFKTNTDGSRDLNDLVTQVYCCSYHLFMCYYGILVVHLGKNKIFKVAEGVPPLRNTIPTDEDQASNFDQHFHYKKHAIPSVIVDVVRDLTAIAGLPEYEPDTYFVEIHTLLDQPLSEANVNRYSDQCESLIRKWRDNTNIVDVPAEGATPEMMWSTWKLSDEEIFNTTLVDLLTMFLQHKNGIVRSDLLELYSRKYGSALLPLIQLMGPIALMPRYIIPDKVKGHCKHFINMLFTNHHSTLGHYEECLAIAMRRVFPVKICHNLYTLSFVNLNEIFLIQIVTKLLHYKTYSQQ